MRFLGNVVVLGAVLGGLGVVNAADQGVLGRRLVLVDGARDRLVFLSRDGILAPARNGPDDPTVVGASLVVENPTTSEQATFVLPAGGWRVNAAGTTYRYRNRQSSEVQVAVLRDGRRLRVRARATGITLDETSQGSLRVRLTSGTQRYCALFGGSVRRDQPGRFIARNAPVPAACEGAVPTTTTTSTTSTTDPGVPTTSTTSTTATTISFADLADTVTPTGDADGDGFSNQLELASCSNPADPTSTPENDSSLCANATIFSDTLGPAWGNTNNMSEPTYNAAVTTLQADNAAECGVYCQSTPNIGSPEACNGNWPWSGVPEHGFYEDGETLEVNFTDESGNGLEGSIFLPPGVTCTPSGEPLCDGVTDAVTCTAPGGATYPAVVICDGFTGSERMYYWAGHRLAREGYIAMTFDVSGQGRSQGQFPNPDASIAADSGEGGFSRDLGTAMNFVVSAANPVRDLIAVSPLLITNQATGAADHTEPYVLGVAGHSAGATGAIAYQQSTETGVYPVRARAAVGWSAFDAENTIGNVPIQVHSGDEDTGFIQPPGSAETTAGENENRYDRLAGDRDDDGTPDFTPSDRQVIIIEEGTHLNYSQVPWAYYPTWAEEVQYHYTLAWFDKYLRGDVARTMSDVSGNVIQSVDVFGDYAECVSGTDCFTATERLEMSHIHLSDVWCSRYDIGGNVSEDMKGGGCATE